jgi:hypothetical protein
MANVALLRMKGKLDPLLPRAETQTAAATGNAPAVSLEQAEATGARQ